MSSYELRFGTEFGNVDLFQLLNETLCLVRTKEIIHKALRSSCHIYKFEFYNLE